MQIYYFYNKNVKEKMKFKRTTESFIEAMKQIHGNKYDYSKTEYINNLTKTCVICPKHGEFLITPKDHKRGNGCPKCKFEKLKQLKSDTQETFLKKYKNKYGGEMYDTSKVEYEKSNMKICLICHQKDKFGNEHGEFWMTPNSLLMGCKCPKCSKVYHQTTDEFIAEARHVHGDKYDYSKVEYVNAKTKVCIICPEHGEFWQLPYAHLKGQGCPKCSMSHMENNISQLLKENNIGFEYETNLNGLLKRMSIDFYIPAYNLAIECQGGQHFYSAFNRHDEEKACTIHKKVLERDIKKKDVLIKNNIKTLYYTDIKDLPSNVLTNTKYNGIYTENNLLTDKHELIQKIMGVDY